MAKVEPYAVMYRNIIGPFAAAREAKLDGKESKTPQADVETDEYIAPVLVHRGSADSHGSADSRGRTIVVILFKEDSQYLHSSAALAALLFKKIDVSVSEVLLITVPQKTPSKTISTAVADVAAKHPSVRIRILSYIPFLVNVLAHKLVPPHTILSEKEAEEYLADQMVSKEQLPSISEYDPPIIWLGGRSGQLVKIRRFSDTAIEAIVVKRITSAMLDIKEDSTATLD